MGTDVALSDLLSVSDLLSPAEDIRVTSLETMVGQCLARLRQEIVCTIHGLTLVSNYEQLTDEEWPTAFSMANFAFAPQIFNAPPSGSINSPRLSSTRKEFTWVREYTIVCVTTHLDDEGNLQASTEG
ncbi:hypothetical protein AZE42_12127 [Rhizopogon vesiculosus]|uniref:Uncharacterized protein n=1 Tax=Rhizopogon vesiculosus TaxID=180088 RepID=A0A1J8PZ98_9AGAM|nr:hypothetical protein AZE42_12127 [Rhizopogon vesiculosus]